MDNVKPTFNVETINTTVETVSSRTGRLEIGAVWERSSRTNTKYLQIKLKITKDKLQQLLNNNAGTNEELVISFVAFPNRDKQVGDNRPNFCIYEDKPRV